MSTIAAPAPPGLMTAEEFWDWCCLPENEDGHYELDEGRVVTVMPPPGPMHGLICAWVTHLLWSYVLRHGQGHVFSHDTALLLARNPEIIRGPDAMVFLDPVPADMPARFVDRVPVLVVEVFSPSDRPGRLVRRVRQFHARGIPLVWVVFPEDRTVAVYQPNLPPDEFGEPDTLGGFDALPGFECRVADLFNLPGRPPAAPTGGA